MARHSRKLPFASAGAEPDISIKEADWQLIEGEYQNKLPSGVRKAVLEATQEFLCFEVFERTAERASDAEVIIDACKKGASNFQRTLLAHAFRPSDAGVYAKYLIKKNFHDHRLKNKDTLFDTLGGLLTSLHVACDAALRDLSDPAMPSHIEGDMWNLWVWRLTKVIANNSLPVGVSKDGLSTSRFVALVRELQKLLPVECRRSTQSDAALAKAIYQARRKGARWKREVFRDSKSLVPD